MSAQITVPHTCEHCRKELKPGTVYHADGFLFCGLECLREWRLKRGIPL